MERAKKVIRQAGGAVDGEDIRIPVQAPKPPKLEQWEPGIPDKRIAFSDPAWSWKGEWKVRIDKEDDDRAKGKVAETAGAEATLSFEGTAVILVGPLTQNGGKADVYLDGKKAGEINAYIVPRTYDDALWHTYGLKQGPHLLRIVTRADADSRSNGKMVALRAAVTYRHP
jgi:hypothetical protein